VNPISLPVFSGGVWAILLFVFRLLHFFLLGKAAQQPPKIYVLK
jgi:hypothetical protein